MAILHSSILGKALVLGTLFLQAMAAVKSFTTTNGNTYVYDFFPPQNSQATVLLIHGYPSSRVDWSRQIQNLTDAGFGVIAPDMLGYGDSDKPLDPARYRLKTLSQDLDAIMGHEKLDTVVGVGHDWGSGMLSALAAFYPKRFEKLAFVAVGYSPPGFLDIDAINAQGLKNQGFTPFGYWYFFNSYDTEDVIRKSIDSFWHLVFPDDSSLWRDNLGAIAGTRAWLNNKNTTGFPSWRSEADKAAWIKHYSVPGAMDASLNFYRAAMRGVQTADGLALTQEDKVLKVPVLAVGTSRDVILPPAFTFAATKPWASNGYTEKTLNAGHWPMLETPNELSAILIDFSAR